MGEALRLGAAEDRLEDAVHLAGVTLVIAPELFGGAVAVVAGVTKAAGAGSQFFRSGRERVSLGVVDHLQLVLHIAQEDVSLRERVALFRRDERLIAKRAETFHCISLAYLRDLSAVADLQRLDDQFDFADAARAQFDVTEALLLADKIAVMKDGRILGHDTPAALLAAPPHEYVRRLMEMPKRQAGRLAELSTRGA